MNDRWIVSYKALQILIDVFLERFDMFLIHPEFLFGLHYLLLLQSVVVFTVHCHYT